VDSISEPLDPNPAPLTPVDPPPTPFTLSKIFLGPFGLRAVWSLLIYIALFACVQIAARTILRRIHPPTHAASAAAKPGTAPAKPSAHQPQSIKPFLIGESIGFAVLLLLSWLMAVIERRRIGAYGLGGPHFLHRFFHGAFWGLAALSLIVLLLHTFHLLTFDGMLDHGAGIFGWGAVLLLGFLLVGLLEEYLFRGYLQFTLTRGLVWLGQLLSPAHARGIAFWTASILTSALFLYAHTGNSGEDKFGLISVFLAGVVFVVALWRTGSLWWAIGFHMAWDWAQSFLYGVPDSGQLVQGRLFATHPSGNPMLSGGTVGPEGSVLLVPVLALVLVVLFYTHPSPQPPLETKPTKTLPPQLAA
jgi:membrane protease YdiL (CAAX protease family)